MHDRPPAQFSGELSFHEASGSLDYSVFVSAGRVIGGTATDEILNDPPLAIVGGWYDRSNLSLLLQMPGENIESPFFTQMKQFRRSGESLQLQHYLYDYGQTEIPEGAVPHDAFTETRDYTLDDQDEDPVGDLPNGTSKLIIRQEKGTMCYEFHHLHGRVISGRAYHRNSGKVRAYIVGGWYDNERLVLAFQFRTAYSSRNQYFSHVHQFRRNGDRFVIEHSLFGFGKGAGSSAVHVIDNEAQMEEADRDDAP